MATANAEVGYTLTDATLIRVNNRVNDHTQKNPTVFNKIYISNKHMIQYLLTKLRSKTFLNHSQINPILPDRERTYSLYSRKKFVAVPRVCSALVRSCGLGAGGLWGRC